MPHDADKAQELVLAHISRFATYHSQKETMTWSGTTFYVVAVAVLLGTGREPFWHMAPWWKFFPFVGLLVLTAYVAFKFVGSQFKRRTEAHYLVLACCNIASRWTQSPPTRADYDLQRLGRPGFSRTDDLQWMPHAVVAEFEAIRRDSTFPALRFQMDDESLAALLMWSWTVAGAGRLLLAWHPFAVWVWSLGS